MYKIAILLFLALAACTTTTSNYAPESNREFMKSLP